MRFYADLHIHSRYSRACSRDCDLEHLAWWAGRKGIAVVGTGDFTHPAWAQELRQNLVPAEPGMFRLRPDLERDVLSRLPVACRTPVRFVLSSEISTIYKRDGHTRKVHHLLYAPSLSAIDEITRRLGRVGNLAADGRPILGLDSRDLLEITLAGGDGCYLVPAHAWTPWFAVLGSQSGFDRVDECYADLAEHVFALETGLSSDPEMNWRVSSLDRYRLVSNSDAHSPPMLGREATMFDTDVDYFAIEHALRTGEGFGGTVEFFPEEGKYHLDGHRACGVRTSPEETRAAGGKCPACGKTPTIGVQHRVEALADRPAGYRPGGAADYRSFVPLPEILGEIAGVGAKSKSVTAQVSAMVDRFGPELSILGEVPLDDLAAKAPSIVAEAIARLRRGEVRREAGYDGVYGTIRLFDAGELTSAALFDLAAPRKARHAVPAPAAPPVPGPVSPAGPVPAPAGLDPQQQAIVAHEGGPLLVVAGPGAGKTRVLTHAIAHRIDRGLSPERCLAVTFTRRARDELRERLAAQVGEAADRVTVATFHGLGLLILRDQCKRLGLDAGLKVADEPTRLAVLRQLSAGDKPAALASRISASKRAVASLAGSPSTPGVDDGDAALVARYDAALRERGLVDVDDLLTLPVTALAGDPALAEAYRSRWTDVYVDEYQDVDELQYRLLRLLCLPGGRPPGPPGCVPDEKAGISGTHSGPRGRPPGPPGSVPDEKAGISGTHSGPRGRPPGPPGCVPDEKAGISGTHSGPLGRPPGPPGCVPDEKASISGTHSAIQPRICVIGDPDQAIYGFRGGDVGYFLRFRADFPAAQEARLSRGYRSAPTIIHAAMQLIRPGTLVPGRELVPARTDIPDGPVAVIAAADERDEAETVATEIEKMLGGASFHALDSRAVDGRDRSEHQLSFADFAVLYRTTAQAAAIGDALGRRGFPFQRRSHERLADMAGVPEILAALSAPVLDSASVPASVPVARRLDEAVRAALSSVLDGPAGSVRDGVHYDAPGGGVGRERAEAIAAIRGAADVLAPLAARCGGDLDRFLDELALGAEVDTWDPRADRISLLTLHAAKGLEFPVVFIAGCDDGLLPLRPWHGATVDYAEERRLLFVGMTRATTRLVLLTAAKRSIRGTVTSCAPSPFLASVDPALLDRRGGPAAGRAQRRDKAQQARLF